MTLVKRQTKGSALTHAELDANWDHVMARANHTGEQAISTVTGLSAALLDTVSPAALNAIIGSLGISSISGLQAALDGKAALAAGMPTGGTTGQVLAKSSGTNFDATWVTPAAGASDLPIRNVSGATLVKGSPVKITGQDAGGRYTVILAEADVAGSMPCSGILTTDVANNADGIARSSGEITGLNTSSFSIGDPLFVSTTAGVFTATAPTTGDAQEVARVAKVGTTDGAIIAGIREMGRLVAAETVTTNPLHRTGAVGISAGGADYQVSPETMIDQWRTETLVVPLFDNDANVAAGVVKHAWAVIDAQFNGWNVIDAALRSYTQGVTGATELQVIRRRGTTNANVLSTRVTLGAEVYVADGVIDAANDDLATGDMIGFEVAAIHSGTAPQGLTAIVKLRKPAA